MTAQLTAKLGENQRNWETPGDKAARAECRQRAPAAILGRLLANWEK
jgi:hypothetical protein